MSWRRRGGGWAGSRPTPSVWDVDDLEARPPWGDETSDGITDVSDYFVTADGRELFEVLREALEHAQRTGVSLAIE